MGEGQTDRETEVGMDDRALHPRSIRDRKDRRLMWAQMAASSIDAAAKLADIAVRFIR